MLMIQFCSWQGQDISEIENQLTSEMQVVAKWLDENDLIINLNKGKTESMLLGTSRRIQNNSINVYLNDKLINFTTKYRYLGVLGPVVRTPFSLNSV